MKDKSVILTGIRANNDLHIGNYLGAILPTVDMAQTHSNEYQVSIFVPDLHSFTTPIDHTALFDGIMNNLKVYIAAGLPLDNPNVHIYRQSYIPAHSELAWILDCFTGFGEMSRMTEFKDKSKKLGTERISMGQFNYPVLMAADILLYGAEYVPVGDDQTQHIEFTRDIAMRLNAKFGDIFTVPYEVKKQHEFFGNDQGLRIKDLVDPSKKMSKSDDTGKGVIFLNDSSDAARKKILNATTDSKEKVAYNPIEQPGISNLLEIFTLLGGDKNTFMGHTQYGPLKQAVADKVCVLIEEFQLKLQDAKEDEILAKLSSSEQLMNTTANSTLLRVQKAVGLRK